MTASEVFKQYADVNGFVSVADLQKIGWTKAKAEYEGLIIKENFRPVTTNY